MSRYMNVKYNSPFVGLFLFAPDYIKLLQNIELVFYPISFITKEQSKYKQWIEKDYVIGLLPENIEIHFLHYKTEEEALQKWETRLKRLNLNNLIVKFSDRDCCTDDLIEQFDKLPFKNKVCFTSKDYPKLRSVCQIVEQQNLTCVENCWEYSNKYWPVILHANEAGGYKNSIFTKLLCRIMGYIPLKQRI